ncbi:hypothetical protein [Deinococcus ruber]|uniref:Uncharacterized protein n=1 Tax=Deinococcus ruber TaxID=1848197 RepID=A0A918KWW4_9DEIO|nr:hypothetical protein [Deinococcus ruber]GGR37846.1 hypothetical protein GCM10008957_53910 [Deinococcus ruber]
MRYLVVDAQTRYGAAVTPTSLIIQLTPELLTRVETAAQSAKALTEQGMTDVRIRIAEPSISGSYLLAVNWHIWNLGDNPLPTMMVALGAGVLDKTVDERKLERIEAGEALTTDHAVEVWNGSLRLTASSVIGHHPVTSVWIPLDNLPAPPAIVPPELPYADEPDVKPFSASVSLAGTIPASWTPSAGGAAFVDASGTVYTPWISFERQSGPEDQLVYEDMSPSDLERVGIRNLDYTDRSITLGDRAAVLVPPCLYSYLCVLSRAVGSWACHILEPTSPLRSLTHQGRIANRAGSSPFAQVRQYSRPSSLHTKLRRPNGASDDVFPF